MNLFPFSSPFRKLISTPLSLLRRTTLTERNFRILYNNFLICCHNTRSYIIQFIVLLDIFINSILTFSVFSEVREAILATFLKSLQRSAYLSSLVCRKCETLCSGTRRLVVISSFTKLPLCLSPLTNHKLEIIRSGILVMFLCRYTRRICRHGSLQQVGKRHVHD